MKSLTINEKRYWRVIAAIIGSFFLFVSLWTGIDSINKGQNVEREKINYRINKASKYEVLLKNGELTTTKDLKGSDIDKVKINFEYLISISEFFNSSSSHYVVASLKSIDADKTETIMENTHNLSNEEQKKDGISSYKIKETVEIDYDIYKAASQELDSKKDYVLEVVMHIRNEIDLLNISTSYIENNEIKFSLPISDNYIEIEAEASYLDKAINYGVLVDKDNNYLLLIISILIIVFVLPISIYSYKEIYRLSTYAYYDKKVKKIHKENRDNLVELMSKPKFESELIMDINSFDNLKEISKDLGLSIYFYADEYKNQISYTVVSSKMVYRYILYI